MNQFVRDSSTRAEPPLLASKSLPGECPQLTGAFSQPKSPRDRIRLCCSLDAGSCQSKMLLQAIFGTRDRRCATWIMIHVQDGCRVVYDVFVAFFVVAGGGVAFLIAFFVVAAGAGDLALRRSAPYCRFASFRASTESFGYFFFAAATAFAHSPAIGEFHSSNLEP